MGNMVMMQCCAGVSVVRVMRPNGKMEELEGQIRVCELMLRYPQHLVIHANCFSRDIAFDNHRKVTILPPDYQLLPGQEYILHRIPPQLTDFVSQTFAKQQMMAAERSRFCAQSKKMHKKSLALQSTRQHLATVLQSMRNSEKEDLCEEQKVASLDDFNFQCSASWKPSLHSIPEVPANASSVV